MLGDNIRKYRKANNMSQDELAEKLQVTRQSVSLWETEQTQPSLDNVVALAKIFQVSTDALLRGEQAEPAKIIAAPASCEQPEKQRRYGWVIAVCLIAVAALAVTVWLLWDRPADPDLDGMTISAHQSSDADRDSTTDPTDEPTVSITTEEPTGKTQLSIYDYLKAFVVENGTINGDYCSYTKTADAYGGYRAENFSLFYWGDTDTVEFSLYKVLDDTYSISFSLRIPKEHTGTYEYITSHYYRENGNNLYAAAGTIEAGSFTKNYPLTCMAYTGSAEQQNAFMETSRKGICELLACLEQFLIAEELEYSFAELGFTKF